LATSRVAKMSRPTFKNLLSVSLVIVKSVDLAENPNRKQKYQSNSTHIT
jgi:hypothetical protein